MNRIGMKNIIPPAIGDPVAAAVAADPAAVAVDPLPGGAKMIMRRRCLNGEDPICHFLKSATPGNFSPIIYRNTC